MNRDTASSSWSNAIRLHTEQIGFNQFDAFIKAALCEGRKDSPELRQFWDIGGADLDLKKRSGTNCSLGPFAGFIPGVDLYGVLKLASEIFLLLRCGICRPVDSPDRLLTTTDYTGGSNTFDVDDAPATPADIKDLNERLTRFLGHDPGGYVSRIIQNIFGTQEFKRSPFCPASVGFDPCLMELIWSYWHEQGMLIQTTNAIALRFQNYAGLM